jgi:hypothetical protein
MNSAAMDDYENLFYEITEFSKLTKASLLRLKALLAKAKMMQDPKACKHIKPIFANQCGINELQETLDQISHLLAVRLWLTKKSYHHHISTHYRK